MIKIKINRQLEEPLYAQIRDAVIKAINEDELKPGDKIPAIQAFVKELHVTQATILRAFEDLTKQNYIVSFVGRGTFVNSDVNKTNPQIASPNHFKQSPLEPADPDFALAARRLRTGVAKSLEALNVLLARPNLIHFTSGITDPSIAENDVLKRCTIEALKKGQEKYQGYSPSAGMIELRKAIAKRFTKNGTSITPDHVLITNGTQQAVSILAQVALENKYRVLCEVPCYMNIPNAFGSIGHWVESIIRDAHGPLPEKLNRYNDGKKSMLYTCSFLHNPMGTDISPERTKMIKEWATEQDSLVISDEIFHDIHFNEVLPVSYFNQFGNDRTIVIGSISKSFMCGMRIGWMIANPDNIRSFSGFKRAMDIGCPSLMQGIALELFESGEYEKHIKRAKEHYKIRRDAVLMELKKHMPKGIKWTTSQGSMHMWLELPQGYSSIALFLLAVEKGVVIGAGPNMDIDHRFINGFKLSYGSVTLSQIHEGVELLADAVKTLLKNPPSDPGLTGLGDFL